MAPVEGGHGGHFFNKLYVVDINSLFPEKPPLF